MADEVKNNKKAKAPWITALATALTVGVIGWVLLAQSWAKDAGHALLLEKIDRNAVIADHNTETLKEHETLLRQLATITERLTVLQEGTQKQLDRIERKLP